jgi:serine/threonine protein kinase
MRVSKGTIINDLYKINRPLGDLGGTSSVYLVENSKDSGQKMVIKLAFTDENDTSNEDVLLERESLFLQNWEWRHPGIVRLFPIPYRDGCDYMLRAIDLPGGPNFMVMEYLEGESLAKCLPRIRKFPIEWKLELFYQIVIVVAHLHSKYFGHRDLKPENIVFRKEVSVAEVPQPVLIDFALTSNGDKDMEIVRDSYTLEYASPERILRTMGTKTPDFTPMQEDIWSLGIILYEILTGKHPMKGNRDHIRTSIISGEVARHLLRDNPNLPSLLAKFLRDMLHKHPKGRPPLKAVITALEENFLPPRIKQIKKK